MISTQVRGLQSLVIPVRGFRVIRTRRAGFICCYWGDKREFVRDGCYPRYSWFYDTGNGYRGSRWRSSFVKNHFLALVFKPTAYKWTFSIQRVRQDINAFSLDKVHWFQRIPKYICMLYLLIVICLGAVDLFSYYHIRKRNETLEKSISRIFNGKGSKCPGKTASSRKTKCMKSGHVFLWNRRFR